MATRTTAHQAEVSAVLTKDDHDLYQIVKIGSTCPICAPLEGRVYSKSGMDPNYPPLSLAFGKIDPAGGDDLSNTYLCIHPNCLHSLIKYTEMGKTDKQIQKMRDFSNPETNPLDVDPRSKRQIKEYQEKERNRRKLLSELRKKNIEKAEIKNSKELFSGGRKIVDNYSPDAFAFASKYYEEIRHLTTDCARIAKNTGESIEDIKKIKSYLFLDKSYYNADKGEYEQFHPDCAIAQSWQRLFLNDHIKPHDLTLIKHEVYEMEIKRKNPGIDHYEAHKMAEAKYNYQKEADEYYDNLEKLKKSRGLN
jgi:hypothetical protein